LTAWDWLFIEERDSSLVGDKRGVALCRGMEKDGKISTIVVVVVAVGLFSTEDVSHTESLAGEGLECSVEWLLNRKFLKESYHLNARKNMERTRKSRIKENKGIKQGRST
jgi:hypothetical protein